MQSVDLRIAQADFAHTLGAMRQWLDHEGCKLSHFRHAADDGAGIAISVGFANGDDAIAEAFRLRFAGAA